MTTWVSSFFREIKGNPTLKSRIIVFLYRLSSVFFSKKRNPLKYFFIFFVILYYAIVEMLWGVEIKPKTRIGWGLKIFHPTAIIINPGSVIGENLILRHGITIGNKYNKLTGVETQCPVVGNNVELGAYATILGDITIGDDSIIGAMAYVDFNIEKNSIVAANRGLILRNGKHA